MPPDIFVYETPSVDAGICECGKGPTPLTIPGILALCEEHLSEYTNELIEYTGMPDEYSAVHCIVHAGARNPRWRRYWIHFFGVASDLDPEQLTSEKIERLPQLIWFVPTSKGIRVLQTWRRTVYWVEAPGFLEDLWSPTKGHTAPQVHGLLPTSHSRRDIATALKYAQEAYQVLLHTNANKVPVGRPERFPTLDALLDFLEPHFKEAGRSLTQEQLVERLGEGVCQNTSTIYSWLSKFRIAWADIPDLLRERELFRGFSGVVEGFQGCPPNSGRATIEGDERRRHAPKSPDRRKNA